ncbi:MAG: hypothetical protein ABI920_06620 [Casimicrobiaceae bacterium]
MRTRPLFLSVLATVAAGTGLLAAAPASAQSIDLNSCSAWSINANLFTCTPNNSTPPPAGAPSPCSVSPTSVSLPAGGGAVPNINGTCGSNNGTAATSWTWKVGNAAAQTTNGPSPTFMAGSVSSSTTIVATPYNGSTAGNPINVPVTVAVPTGGGGNSGGGISCAPMGTVVIPLKSVAGTISQSIASANFGSFTNTSIAVVTFTTGANTGSGSVSFAEFASGPVDRTASLSTSPCTFDTQAITTRYGTGNTITFQVGGTNSRKPVLQPNTTYYMNVKNINYYGNPTCFGSSCDIRADVQIP